MRELQKLELWTWNDGDTMNDDDLCSCNSENKFFLLLAFSRVIYRVGVDMSSMWVLNFFFHCCVVHAKWSEKAARKDENEIVETTKKFIYVTALRCRCCSSFPVSCHGIYIMRGMGMGTNLCDVTHTLPWWIFRSLARFCKQSFWISTICHEYDETRHQKRQKNEFHKQWVQSATNFPCLFFWGLWTFSTEKNWKLENCLFKVNTRTRWMEKSNELGDEKYEIMLLNLKSSINYSLNMDVLFQ